LLEGDKDVETHSIQRRSFAFQRLSSPAVLWYFLTILLVASTVMIPRIEAEIAAILLIEIGACEGVKSALTGFRDGVLTGLFIAVFTVIVHTQGSHVLFTWHLLRITSEGVLWACCLGLGMVVMILAARLQMNAMQHVSLGGLVSHISVRAALLCQMALSMIPAVGIRFRQLFELEKHLPSHRTHSSWISRVQPLTYAVLAETLSDSSHRTLALTLLGSSPLRANRPIRAHHGLSLPLLIRSWATAIAATVFMTLLITKPWGTTSWTLDLSAVLLVGIPFIAEGGGRLWSLLHR
jgi:hypothetical protein